LAIGLLAIPIFIEVESEIGITHKAEHSLSMTKASVNRAFRFFTEF
jgi:hypothetical protein